MHNASFPYVDPHGHGHCSPSDTAARSSLMPVPLPLLTIPNLEHQTFAVAEFDSVHEVMKLANYPDASYSSSSTCCSSGGSCYNSPSSFSNYENPLLRPCLFQRSISSTSLQKNDGYYGPFTSTAPESAESETCNSVRRVYSTGDLQRVNGSQHKQRVESPLMSESNMIIEGMNRACRYSPEEKKERIERYRSKRNQRNFNKKIKYACRKTLADSRPRIRGRFARNDETETSGGHIHEMMGEAEDEEEEDNWANFLEAFSSGSLLP